MIDSKGFRAGVGIIIINSEQKIFWAKRVRQDAWQFPQGGMMEGETPLESMYRELNEEVGLKPEDVSVVSESRRWLYYRLPKRLIRRHSLPLCIGQKQKWFLLKLVGDESKIHFDETSKPEFDDWRWVDYWYPLNHVIEFKAKVYKMALKEFSPKVLKNSRRKRNRLFGKRTTE